MKHDVYLYLKVFGLAVDENGKKDYAGTKICIGKSDRDIPYWELTAKTTDFAKEVLTKMLPVEGIKASDLTVITPEEYARNYGDVDEAENPVL